MASVREPCEGSRHFIENGCKFESGSNAFIAWLAKTGDLKISHCPVGYHIRELTVEEAIFAHSHWKYRSNETFALFQCSAKDGLGVGAFCNASGNLVSWSVLSWDGAMAALTTIPGHQGKGLAKAVISSLSQKVIERKMVPYVYIEEIETSYIPEKLFRNLGFTVERETCFYLAVVQNADQVLS